MNLNLKDLKSSQKIVIVSEDIQFKNILSSRLRMENFDIKLSNSGFHTLFLLEQMPDIKILIVHDNMRDMSGQEIIELTRTLNEESQLPIIFISKNKKAEESEFYKSMGANDFLVQSTNFNPIVESVQRLIKFFHVEGDLKKIA